MSSTFRMDVRQRWAARRVTVTRWLKHPGDTFKLHDPVVEIEVDGVPLQLTYRGYPSRDPECAIYWRCVEEGQEVGPWGDLFEFTDWQLNRPGPVISNKPK